LSGGDQAERFLARLAQSLADGSFVKLVLAGPRKADAGSVIGAEPGLQRVLVRCLKLKGVDHLSFVFRHDTRDVTKNLVLDDGLAQVRGWLGGTFRNAHLATRGEELQLVFGKKGLPHLGRTALAAAAGGSVRGQGDTHDRARQRWVDPQAPFLHALGVTDAQQRVVPAMARKWKQINKFVEIFAGAVVTAGLADLPQPVRVADFGAGKGYLTFAVHDWLTRNRPQPADVTGVEQRPDMVSLGNDAVASLGLQGLRFEQGDLRTWQPAALDVVIALHACDTATDHAIHLGVRAGAKVILCAPCCHQQLRPQLLSPHPLRPLLQHGVHQAQQAEMLTDGLRAMLLDACGYQTQVFEFVALEHTQKNKMILAVRRTQRPAAAPLLAQVADLKQFYGIRDHCLETLLRADGLLAAASDADAWPVPSPPLAGETVGVRRQCAS
jgi:protein-L-isoaspartate O-methyltransferase